MTNIHVSNTAQQIVDILGNKSVAIRLEEVVNLIDDAANRTIDLIENSLPMTEMIIQDCINISKKIASKKVKDGDSHVAVFLDNLTNTLSHVHNSMEEIILAQKNQYATAMVVNKFIDDLKDLDSKLVEIIENSCDKTLEYETNIN